MGERGGTHRLGLVPGFTARATMKGGSADKRSIWGRQEHRRHGRYRACVCRLHLQAQVQHTEGKRVQVAGALRIWLKQNK